MTVVPEENLLNPKRPTQWSGKSVAVIGSGGLELSVAEALNSLGHSVVVFEKENAIGRDLTGDVDGLILGLQEVGVTFSPGVEIGRHLLLVTVLDEFDAVFKAKDDLFTVNHERQFSGESGEVSAIVDAINETLQ